jgi:hypothetical protein
MPSEARRGDYNGEVLELSLLLTILVTTNIPQYDDDDDDDDDDVND